MILTKKEKRDITVGDMVVKLENKQEESAKVFDLTQWQLKELNSGFEECYQQAKKYSPDKTFYMVAWVKSERIFNNRVLHPYFISRKSCPTPQYDQTVFRCPPGGEPEFLWTLPDKVTYEWYLSNTALISPDKWNLLKFVLADDAGDLLRMAKKFNGESIDGES